MDLGGRGHCEPEYSVCLLLSHRNAMPMFRVLPAQLRLDMIPGAIGVHGAGQPLIALLDRRTSGTRLGGLAPVAEVAALETRPECASAPLAIVERHLRHPLCSARPRSRTGRHLGAA